eukprot:COSAG06_NODE_3276_length_5572_cov_1.961637_4_plen_59_part_00
MCVCGSCAGLGCVSTLLVCHTAMLWLDLSTIDSLKILTNRCNTPTYRPPLPNTQRERE